MDRILNILSFVGGGPITDEWLGGVVYGILLCAPSLIVLALNCRQCYADMTQAERNRLSKLSKEMIANDEKTTPTD